MHALGHPVLGDFEYAGNSMMNKLYRTIDRGHLALVAYRLAFRHPITHQAMQFEITPPLAFQQCCQKLEIPYVF